MTAYRACLDGGDGDETRLRRRRFLGWLTALVPTVGVTACSGEAETNDGTAMPGDEAEADAGGSDADPAMDAAPGPDAPGAEADAMVADETTVDATEPACAPTGKDALGPFHEPGAPFRTVIADANEPGERLYVQGTVYGADCTTPVAGAIVDVWHADTNGVYHTAQEQYRLRGQMKTDAQGRYAFETIQPGHYDNRPKHIHYMVTHPSQAPLVTQMYFAGDPRLGANDTCQPPTCNSYDPERIVTLTTTSVEGGSVLEGTFDMRLGVS